MTDPVELMPIAERLPLNRVRKAMAKAMATTVSTAALSQVSRSIDLAPLIAIRDAADPSRRFSINTYVMAAVARVLPAHPLLNGRLVDNEVHVPAVVNLGMAVATDLGLLVPVIHGANAKTIPELDAAAKDLAERARSGALRMVDIDAGTFTVSNLGMMGIDTGFALPPPPQAAIIVVGRARPRVAPADEGFMVTNEASFGLTVTIEASFGLTYDHRFVDGATAAALLADLSARLAVIAGED